METTKGFYKLDNDTWLYTPNYVESTGYVLIAEDKDQYTYPIDGWVWYDNAPSVFETPFVNPVVVSESIPEPIPEPTPEPTPSPTGIFTRIRNFFGI